MKFSIRLLLVLLLIGLISPAYAAEPAEGTVYLTVSSIDMTLVGDQENIYAGTVPADAVTWSSEDDTVISVENGVLTAVGVGSTVIHADYQDQHWQCNAGCLAESAETLMQLPRDVLNAPKRLPPTTQYDPVPFYSDAALIGDSISYIFYQNEQRSGQLGHPLYLARGGTSINGFVNHFKNMIYRGLDTPLEDAVAMAGKQKLFIMLGQNDLGYMTIEDTMANYARMLELIREKSPDVEIYIQTCAQEYAELGPYNSRNVKIYEFNTLLPEFAREQGCHLVDVAPYLENHCNRLAPVYSLDQGIHVNYDGCLIWGQVLSNFAQLEEIREAAK